MYLSSLPAARVGHSDLKTPFARMGRMYNILMGGSSSVLYETDFCIRKKSTFFFPHLIIWKKTSAIRFASFIYRSILFTLSFDPKMHSATSDLLCQPSLFCDAGGKMRFLACESEARKVDLGVKNKWRHDWLQTEDNLKRKYAIWARKVDEPGMAWCFLCCKKINYRSSGRRGHQLTSKL